MTDSILDGATISVGLRFFHTRRRWSTPQLRAKIISEEASCMRQEAKMDWHRIEENWTRFKQAIREKWGKLTDDDLEAIAGRRKRLEETLHKRYGFAPDHVRKEVDDWLRWQNSKAGEPTHSDEPTNLRR